MQEDISSKAPAADGVNGTQADGTHETASQVGEVKEFHEVVNDLLKTTFKSPEDAVSGLKNTQDYVGKAGKYSKAVNALMTAKGFNEDQAVKYIMDLTQTQEPAVTQAPNTAPESPKTGDFVSRKEFEEAMFYKDNPELATYKDILGALAEKQGKSLSEAAGLESFKTLLDAKKVADQASKSKSVLESNSRLGQVQDKFAQAKELAAQGGRSAGESIVTDAVLEAYDLK